MQLPAQSIAGGGGREVWLRVHLMSKSIRIALQSRISRGGALATDDRGSLADAWTQLQVVLGIFPRTDTMVGAILAIDTAMVGFFFSRWPDANHATSAMVVVTVVYSLCAGFAIIDVYRCAFPNIDGDGTSLVFFRSIADFNCYRSYAEKYSSVGDRQLTTQVLEQVWRNSKILTAKFDRLKSAMKWLLISVVPWIVFFIISAN